MSQITPNPLQSKISALLQLLHQLPHRPADNEPRYISRQHRILEVIAAVFATGRSGDLFAAAFNPEANEIVLAKNGNPTEADLEFANEFFSFTLKPEAKGPVDLFSFLLQRRPEGLNKRIRQVHDAVVDPDFCNDLDSALQRLEPNERLEFPRGQGFIQDNFKGKDPLFVLKSCRDIISEQTQKAFDEATDLPTRSRIYVTIINAANVIVHCSIMKKIIYAYTTVRKVQMHTAKALRYLHVGYVIRTAKQRSSSGEPISHRWVKDVEFIGSGEGEIQLGDRTARDAVRGKVRCVSTKLEKFLDRALPAEDQWQTTVHTSIHPEIRLAFELASLTGVHPIGLSKRSCLACMSWLDARRLGIQLVTSDMFQRKPDESWAIPGNTHLVGDLPVNSVLASIDISWHNITSHVMSDWF